MDPRLFVLHSNFFAILRMPPGKRILALRKVRKRAQELELNELVRRCDRAIASDRESRSRSARWAARRSGRVQYTPELPSIDHRIDVVVTSLRDIARAQIQGSDPNDPLIAEVEAFLAALFPAGVYAVTNLPYSEEIVAVEAILEMLQGEWAEMVVRLGLSRQVARLAELAAAYRAELERSNANLTRDEVETSKLQGHIYLHEIVAMIFGTFNDSSNPEHIDRLAELLAPIMEQMDATRSLRRRRRAQNAAADEAADEGDVDVGQEEEEEGEEEDEAGDSTGEPPPSA